jgi:hypothetical protein
VRLYLGCSKDHLPPRDADAAGIVVSIAAGPGALWRSTSSAGSKGPVEAGLCPWVVNAALGSVFP